MDTKSRLLLLVVISGIAGLFVALLATSNRKNSYAPIGSFVGCYSNGIDRFTLGARGDLVVNGVAAGSYQILKPVGGKHGFLLEADKLTLAGGRGTPIRAARGNGGFYWPITGDTLDVLFAPDVEITLQKSGARPC